MCSGCCCCDCGLEADNDDDADDAEDDSGSKKADETACGSRTVSSHAPVSGLK